MCGIIGMYGKALKVQHEKLFKDLLIMDQIRGPHSTGVAYITDDHVWNYMKAAETASEWVTNPEFKKWFGKMRKQVAMIGHNRWATQGAVNNDNAHPFQHGDVVMVHNGSLWDTDNHPKKFEVDSEGICHWLSHENCALKVLPYLCGAYSLVWYDDRSNTINFARNDERPMYTTVLADGVVVFGSEKGMIEWACARNEFTLHDSGVFSTKPFTLYSVSLQKEDFGKITTREYKEDYTASAWNRYSYSGYGSGYYSPKRKNPVVSSSGYLTEKEDNWLLKHGYKKASTVSVVLTEFLQNETYTNNHNTVWGQWLGYMLDDPDIRVAVYARRDDVLFSVVDDEFFEGSISYVRFDAQTDEATIVLRGDSVKVAEYPKLTIDDDELNELAEADAKEDINSHMGKLNVFGQEMTPEEYDSHCNFIGGCTDCGSYLSHEEAENHVWLSADSVLCSGCFTYKYDDAKQG